MKTMAASQFRAELLKILDDVGPEGIMITKRGRPVATLLPFKSRENHDDLIGILEGKLHILGDVMSTGVEWHAEP
ncbi:MAG: type II toxin-antitoxin system Phd/YefM family antitoxin [Tepidiformaceae bacterium]